MAKTSQFLKKLNFRFYIQLFFLALTAFLALSHQKYGIEKVASIDAYCPFGGVESFFTLILTGDFLKRIYWSSLILLAVYLVGTIILGRVFCGYICPFGAVQEWIYKFSKKFPHLPKFEPSPKLDKHLRKLKYLVLLVIVYFSFYLGDLIFRNYDPYNAMMHFGQEFSEKPVGYLLLLFFLVLALFSKNLWCRYLCPLGAFFGIAKKFSILKLNRDQDSCTKCGACNVICPSGLDIKNTIKINSADCINCGQCVSNCPKSSLKYSIFGKNISKNQHTLLTVLLVILPIFAISNTVWWKTKPATNLVTAQGDIDIANIRGSNTLRSLIEVTKIPLFEFQREFNFPADIDIDLKLKEIGPKYSLKNKIGEPLETQDFRDFIFNHH